jgi:riboflavin kinase/FMN adenylyltransferase
MPNGTYGLSVIFDGKSYFGIGVYLRTSELFEAHLFDFSRDIYGEIITITPLFQIRENQKFSGIEALKSQIEKDKLVMEDWMRNKT